ncbi:MAG: hypothetical protein WCK28_05290 [Burkholderiales bacterium]|jgi:hypothetical protein
MKRPLLALLALSAALGGCGTWTHPTKTGAAYDTDRSICDAGAKARWPQVWRQEIDRPAYIEPGRSTCTTKGNTTDCVNYPPREVPATYRTVDANADAREKASDTCMVDAGWTWKLRSAKD